MTFQIVDKRSTGTRAAGKLWKSWASNSSPIFNKLTIFTSKLNKILINKRIASRTVIPANPKVISIGNLSLGGSGKTPLAIKIASDLQETGLKVAILVRGYGSADAGPFIVGAENKNAGDEALMIAQALPEAVVVQSRDRVQGYNQVKDIVDIVIIEDGFQTAGLSRHIDILILDKWDFQRGTPVPQIGNVIPWGPFRESIDAIDRADCLLVPAEDTQDTLPTDYNGIPIFSYSRNSILSLDDTGDYALISGIANPEQFEKQCIRKLGRNPVASYRYDDHKAYSQADIGQIIDNHGNAETTWFTTAKDYVKLVGMWPDSVDIKVVDLQVKWLGTSPIQFILHEKGE
ncbi:tetraacyldisaccharide 4'-kinase [bacterium]|nr:tetraacyldisaccharide 4'-kinase [bacterium]